MSAHSMAAAMAKRRASSGVSSMPVAYACLAKIGIAPKQAADTRHSRSPSRSRFMTGREGLRGYEGSRRAGLGEGRALVEAGAGIRAVLHGESVDRTHDRQGDRDGDERDHEMQYRSLCARVVGFVDYCISRQNL